MKLPKDDFKKLLQVILDSYPDIEDLRILVRTKLDQNLDTIASGTNNKQKVFNLIQWAEVEGKLKNLLDALSEDRPNNLESQKIIIESPKSENERSRQHLLNSISKKVDDFLYKNLPDGEQIINLSKQSRPDLVFQKIHYSTTSLRHNKFPVIEQNIIDILGENSGYLLIVGGPGSGKTITLYELAKYLISKAKNNPKEPIPIIFDLSSWYNQSIEKWLVSEIEESYTISSQKVSYLIKNRHIIPLLDGLDQVDKFQQCKCIKAINDFIKEFEPKYLVVSCCEEKDKNTLQIKLNGAIYLHPLDQRQIHNYLVYIGKSELWNDIQDKSYILELIKNPLFLSMMLIITKQESNIENWKSYYDDKSESYRFLFDNYIMEKLKNDKFITIKKAKKWLKILAKNLKNDSNNYLLIEKIQPNEWLISNNQKTIYHLIVTLITSIIIYLIVYIIISLKSDNFNINNQFNIGKIKLCWLILSILISYLVSICNSEIKPVETLKIPSIKEIIENILKFPALKQLISPLINNSLNSLFFNDFGISSNFLQMFLRLERSSLGLITIQIIRKLMPVPELRGSDLKIEERNIVNKGIKNSGKNGVLVAVIFGLLCFIIGLILELVSNFQNSNPFNTNELKLIFSSGMCWGLIGGLIGGLFSGLLAYIQHFALRFIIACNGQLPWHYVRFLNYATKQRILQREGGCYRFIHPLLQKHFINMDIE